MPSAWSCQHKQLPVVQPGLSKVRVLAGLSWRVRDAWQACAALLLLWMNAAFASSAFDVPSLVACFKQPSNASLTLTFDEYMTGLPSRLHLHSVLEVLPSPAHASYESVLTIATALNAERLESLAAQCGSWPGLLVAALYHPVVRTVIDGGKQLTPIELASLNALEHLARDTIVKAQSADGSCRLRILLLYEYVDTNFMAALLPINALRNVALLAVSSPLVAMIDVDLLVSSSLGKQLVTGDISSRDARSRKLVRKCQTERAAMILPAFQTPKNSSSNSYPSGDAYQRSVDLVQNLVRGSKSDLYQATAAGVIVPFASQQFSIGHRRTNFRRWFQSDTAYRVEFIRQFEPWYIVDRLNTPLYDINFRGYGRNKQQQAAHLHAVGMSFWVYPDAFVIHMPHEKSQAQKDHDDTWAAVRDRKPLTAHAMDTGAVGTAVTTRARQLRSASNNDTILSQGLRHVRRVDKLFRTFVNQMPSQAYKTLVDVATFACLKELPWWSGNSILKFCTTH